MTYPSRVHHAFGHPSGTRGEHDKEGVVEGELGKFQILCPPEVLNKVLKQNTVGGGGAKMPRHVESHDIVCTRNIEIFVYKLNNVNVAHIIISHGDNIATACLSLLPVRYRACVNILCPTKWEDDHHLQSRQTSNHFRQLLKVAMSLVVVADGLHREDELGLDLGEPV